MVSVNRAFTYAGVPSIVSSLWSAPDKATQELMTMFYQELKEGSSKDQALRQAKLDYLGRQKMEGLKHPFFWAGFVVHGNTEPLKFEGTTVDGKMMLLASGLIFLFGGFLIFKKWKMSQARKQPNPLTFGDH